MLDSTTKLIAKELGLQIAQGVAFGAYQNYAVTLQKGKNCIRMDFAVSFPDPIHKTNLMEAVDAAKIQKTYQIQSMGIGTNRIQIYFGNGFGAAKNITAFAQWFLPLLREHQASTYNFCHHCSMEVTDGRWILLNGTAYFMHESCIRSIGSRMDESNAQRREALTGSYVTGSIGSILGALLGAVIWAFFLMAGFIASAAGFLIGVFSEKGYDLLKGKQGKGKIPVLIVSVILGVILGTIGGYVFIYLREYGGQFGFGEVVAAAICDIVYDPMYVAKDVLVGFLFAAMGVYSLIRSAGHAVADEKITYLT